MKLLITGAAGFIGHHLLDRILTDTDWNVVCLDRLDHAGNLERLSSLKSFWSQRHRVEVCYHDLRAPIGDRIGHTVLTGHGRFDEIPFDHVIHMAAGSHVDRSVLDPTGFIMDNVLGTAHLLDYARRFALNTLVFSTDEVFGSADNGECFDVDARMNPTNPYAATKAGAELLAPAYANTYGMRIQVTRCANVFGERQDPEKFIPLAIRKILNDEEVEIHTRDGVISSRLYTYHRNVTSAVLRVLESGDAIRADDAASGRYNIEGGDEISNVEVATEIARLLGKKGPYRLVENPPGRPRPDMRYSIDPSRLKAIGWEPEIDFRSGIARVVEYELSVLKLAG